MLKFISKFPENIKQQITEIVESQNPKTPNEIIRAELQAVKKLIFEGQANTRMISQGW